MRAHPKFRVINFKLTLNIESNGNFIGVVKNTTQRREKFASNLKITDKIDEMENEFMIKDQKILALEERIKEFREQNLENKGAIDKIEKLYELGIIYENGDPIEKAG